jgi:geranylgeranyl pyrophosphate synthase
VSTITFSCLDWAAVVELVGRHIREIGQHQGPAQSLLDHVLSSQGKMLRAYLVFLTSSLWESASLPVVLDVAAGVELVHLASLIHDDIVDEGERRRGRVSAHRAFGVKEAVLLGDYLFASAFNLFARADAGVIAVMSRAIGEMSLGEINELLQPGRSLTEYWRYIRRKTASFLGACCESGAVLARQGLNHRTVLRQFGEAVGMAFQLTDDVLDYRGSPERLGKSVGKDFALQAWTLPIILAVSRGLLDHSWVHLSYGQVQAILTEGGILDEAWEMALEWLERAQTLLLQLPKGSAARQLEGLLQTLALREA